MTLLKHGHGSVATAADETVQRASGDNKTIQIQAQLSERLTGFVNSTGYTVKDVVNKAVEEFLERYGG
ncbi:hypothetical protein [Brevibacillus marinus]|uniref:hypothetical protein n=1 Tax=Brevibacillus marinus TaxID=2496837 RepID=UPI000F83BAC9|nr:hypothetical protein [Brevibacillus marinus]